MDFSKFVLGLRFPLIDNDAEKTAQKMWNVIFHALSAKEANTLDLHNLVQPADAQHPHDTLLCVLSNMSLGMCRRVYARLCANPRLRANQTFHEPFILCNQAEAMDGYAYLGRVSEDGSVIGGEKSYASMQFDGEEPKRSIFSKRTPTVLVATEGYCGLLSHQETARALMETAASFCKPVAFTPFPLAENAAETVNALIVTLGGRYTVFVDDTSMAPLLNCGVLPNRTVALAAETAESAYIHFNAAKNRGYHSFVIGLQEPLTDRIRDLFDEEQYADTHILLLDETLSAEQYLEFTEFDKYLSRVTTVIGGSGISDSKFTNALQLRCKKHRKHFVLLPQAELVPQTAEEARLLLKKSAELIFSALLKD